MIGSFFVALGAFAFTLALMLNPNARLQSSFAFLFNKVPEPYLYFGGAALFALGFVINMVS